jgi:hypothetical protein
MVPRRGARESFGALQFGLISMRYDFCGRSVHGVLVKLMYQTVLKRSGQDAGDFSNRIAP